jgi:hypothetical protein
MSKAAELANQLKELEVEEGLKLIDEQQTKALFTQVFDDAMYIMHSDGSTNIVEMMPAGPGVHAISAGNTLKVLHTYKPFAEAFESEIH